MVIRRTKLVVIVVVIIVIVVQFCLCCSLFVMAITDICALFHIYRPPRRKVNIIYSMPPACRTPKPRCKCEQSATSEKKLQKVNTVNTMNAMNTRALVGPVAICGIFFIVVMAQHRVSTFPHFRMQPGKVQIKSDGRVWVILYRIVYYYMLYCSLLYLY